MNAKDNLAPNVLAESPVAGPEQKEFWGSDAVAAMLRAIEIPYLALNPGASYRGLHDSIVNYLGNTRPQMLLCLHEESAVAIAQGYAKASDRMMGAVVHSNVGLMHASMAIFNAWCDRDSDADPGRHRALGRSQAPALDRLDPHRVRPGRAGARLHQVGQPARVGACGLRGDPARGADRQHRAARPDLRQSGRRTAGSKDRRAAAASGRETLSRARSGAAGGAPRSMPRQSSSPARSTR